jgi:hypothetical protein
MSKLYRYIHLPISLALLMTTLSYAQPDLTTPIDFSLLHSHDTSYRFVTQTFNQPAPQLDTTDENTQELAKLATPRNYQVWLAIPEGYDSSKPANVLYLLDGNGVLDDLQEATLRDLTPGNSAASTDRKQPPILVLIGYQTPYRFDVAARAYDYTPPLLTSTGINTAFQEAGRARLNGGAETFYTLIEDEIKPWVAQRLGTAPASEAIWGHSYGGLFVLYTLLKHPEAYQNYYSADPSLWWQDGEMTQYWQAYQASFAAQPIPQGVNKQSPRKTIRLTFSGDTATVASRAAAISEPVTAVADQQAMTPADQDKQRFAKEVCQHFVTQQQAECSYQQYKQSHGELFTSSLLDTLKRFK